MDLAFSIIYSLCEHLQATCSANYSIFVHQDESYPPHIVVSDLWAGGCKVFVTDGKIVITHAYARGPGWFHDDKVIDLLLPDYLERITTIIRNIEYETLKPN